MSAALHRARYTGHDGLALAADVGGEPAGAPVILLHGGGQTRHAWSGAARELAGHGYRVISLDLRGHGDSGWAEGAAAYRLDAFAADLRAVAATLEQPPVLVGASLGGAAALLATGESAPDFARALVLVDSVPRAAPAGVHNIYSFMSARPDGYASLDEVADAVAAYNPHRPRPAASEGLMKNLRRGANGRLYWHWDPQLVAPGHRIEPEAWRRQLEAAAAGVRIPTLLVRGAMSDVVSLDAARELQRAIPGCELVDVSGAGHMVAGDRNDAFNGAVLDFLRRRTGQVAPAA